MDLELSDNQRRFVCRILFLTLCVVPTGAVAYAAFHKKSPAQWAETIQAEIGLPTRIGLVRTPLPGQLVIHDFAITSPDGEEILSAIQAKVDLDRNKVRIEGPVNVTPQGLYHLVSEASQRALGAGQGDTRWQFEFANLNIVRTKHETYLMPFDNVVQLSPAWVDIGPVPTGREIVLRSPGRTFDGGNFESTDWRVFSLDRNFHNSRVDLVLVCPDGESLPVWAVPSTASREIEKVTGANARFTGKIHVSDMTGNTEIHANGQFYDVQLPGRGNELASVEVYNLHISDSQWMRGEASLQLPGKRAIALDNQTMPSTSAATQMIHAIRQATHESEISNNYR